MKLMTKPLLILLFLPLFLFSQINISGVVKDKETGTLIENATVMLKPYSVSGGGYYSGLKTQKNGVFDLSTNFKYPFHLIATKNGCVSEKIKIKKGTTYVEVVFECEEEAIKEIIKEQTSDVDSDGVLDRDDKCPDEAGVSENDGCPWPDNDSDGVANKDDTCPEESGAAENQGCPWPDGDGDGVADKDDACPDEAGVAANKGCPAEPKEIKTMIVEGSAVILFNAESKTIRDSDNSMLANLAALLSKYPHVSITLEGHASSDGSKAYNQKLSEDRANSTKMALEALGVSGSRINVIGHGEDKPVMDNNTAKNRAQNRRVNFTL